MNKKLLSGIFLIPLITSGAVQSSPPSQIEQLPVLSNPVTVSSNVSVKRDDFKKLTEFLGPNLAKYPLVEGLYIRAWRPDASDLVSYQIYINNYYFDRHWHFYDSAWDSSGTELNAKSIDRNVERCFDDGCARNEHIGIAVDRNYLDARAETGEKIQISGKAGASVFHIPPDYIKGFLKRVDEEATIKALADASLRTKMLGNWSAALVNARGESGAIKFSLNPDNTFSGEVVFNNTRDWTFSGTWKTKDNKIIMELHNIFLANARSQASKHG